MTTEEILKKFNISIVYEHMLYFSDINDYAVGVLAEDTIYMILNIERKDYPSISIEEIEENLKMLKEIAIG